MSDNQIQKQQKEVPTLIELSANALHSPDARDMALYTHKASRPLDFSALAEMELAYIQDARGSLVTLEETYCRGVTDVYPNYKPKTPRWVSTMPGYYIDSARFYRYDPNNQTVVIRIDHSKLPEFWMEIHLPLKLLKDDDNDTRPWKPLIAKGRFERVEFDETKREFKNTLNPRQVVQAELLAAPNNAPTILIKLPDISGHLSFPRQQLNDWLKQYQLNEGGEEDDAEDVPLGLVDD